MSEPNKDENGKLRISMDQFDTAFRQLLQGVPTEELHQEVVHADPSKPNPGVGDLVISATEWTDRWKRHADGASSDWFKRAQTPSKDPIKAAIAANAKRQDRLKQAEDDQKWLKKMQKRTFEDYAAGVQAVGERAYTAGVDAKAAKAGNRFAELQPKVLALKQAIGQMSDATDLDREKRMTAARRGMIAIGQS